MPGAKARSAHQSRGLASLVRVTWCFDCSPHGSAGSTGRAEAVVGITCPKPAGRRCWGLYIRRKRQHLSIAYSSHAKDSDWVDKFAFSAILSVCLSVCPLRLLAFADDGKWYGTFAPNFQVKKNTGAIYWGFRFFCPITIRDSNETKPTLREGPGTKRQLFSRNMLTKTVPISGAWAAPP